MATRYEVLEPLKFCPGERCTFAGRIAARYEVVSTP